MFIFLRLLLAHFIGDYPLQINKVYALKFRGLIGVIPHALIVTSCFILFTWPYLNQPLLWKFILFLGIIHLIQDWLKVRIGIIRPGNYFWFYLLDQLLHIGAISLIFKTNLKNLPPPVANGNFLITLYNNNTFILYLMALIIASYNGLYMITNFKKTFLKTNGMYKPFDKWFGIIERGIILSLFFAGLNFLLLLPLAFLLRPLACHTICKRIKPEERFKEISEMVYSWVIAITTGIIFYFILRSPYFQR